MHRRPLLDLLARYLEVRPGEALAVGRVVDLVRGHERCFHRDCWPGHVTASAWIVDHARERFLLTHHRKLGRWLQLGGHADGEARVEEVALREAREESGIQEFGCVLTDGALLPIDVDVHLIPARGAEPAHEHHDVRFLLVAGPGQDLVMSDESHDLRWIPRADLDRIVFEESILRMAQKAWTLLDGG